MSPDTYLSSTPIWKPSSRPESREQVTRPAGEHQGPDAEKEIHARYEAGRPSDYRGTPPPSLPADDEIFEAWPRLLHEARYLAANSSTANAIFDSRVANGVGAGLTYEPLVRDLDGNLAVELNADIRAWHENWSRRVDVTGEMSRAEVERLVWRTWDTDGECFVRKLTDTRFRGIPYRLQVLETEQIPLSMLGSRGIASGIERDEFGAPLIYHVMGYPLGSIPSYSIVIDDLIPVPARAMTHLLHRKRPGQTRGVTLIHAAILRIVDISDYEQSHRLAARASEKMLASINRTPDWTPIQDEDGRQAGDPARWQVQDLEIMDNLMPGESVNFFSPQHPNTAAVDFANMERRQVAACTRTAFSQIAMVFDRSYAAQRLETAMVWRFTEADRNTFISKFARPDLYENPLRWAIEYGRVRVPRGIDNRTLFSVRIDGPTMPVINPTEERSAFEKDQDKGWDSRHGIMRKMGRNPMDVDVERAQDTFMRKESGESNVD